MTDYVGIDEAGRGPVFGPLTIGFVHWDDSTSPPDEIDITDSKELSEAQRQCARQWIENHCRYSVTHIPAWIISSTSDSLPRLEANVIMSVLKRIDVKSVVIDLLSRQSNFERWMNSRMPDHQIKLFEGADRDWAGVSAASILAKTTRDQSINQLKERHGDIGSGYPSDPATRQWIRSRRHYDRDQWPPFVRTSWSTIKDLEQTQLNI